ncbi:SHD1 domain-containing protein [Novipirellula caenicola]|uniref:SLA1 homology domain-containing protein n=1 Tax=Novipirellula caenicola TaxID=1536901 RepID=A0ABP9VNU4_9BACT
MRMFSTLLALVGSLVVATATGNAREWSSFDGQYKIDAEVVAFNDTTVVLKRKSGKLVAVELAELSQQDRDYVASQETKDAFHKSADQMQTWTSVDGMKIRGRVVAYGQKDLVVQRKLGNVMINGTAFARIDPLHQAVILKIISHLEGTKIEDASQLSAWARKTLSAEPKTYPLEGVLMALESGDQISVPFFLFAKEDLAVLQPGWEHWLSETEDEAARERESLMVQTSAMQYQREKERDYQIERMKLDMLAAATGLTSIWEVLLKPRPGVYGRRTSVIVTARNSDIATRMVTSRYPGYAVVGVRRASY